MNEASYADIADAVAWHEQPRLVDLWTLIHLWKLAFANDWEPTAAVKLLQFQADTTLTLLPGGELAKARPQMDHPAFLEYVKAKLGAM